MDVLGFCLTALGFVVGLAGLWFGFRPRRRDPVLVSSTWCTPIRVNRNLEDLQVSWRGTPLREPVILDFRAVHASGPDITKDTFDGGDFVVRGLNVSFVGVIDASEHISVDASERGFSLTVEPLLMKKGDELRARILCDGGPTVERTIRLADVNTSKSIESLRQRETSWWSLGFLFAFCAFMAVGTAVSNALNHRPLGETLAALCFLIIFAVVSGPLYYFLGRVSRRSVAQEWLDEEPTPRED